MPNEIHIEGDVVTKRYRVRDGSEREWRALNLLDTYAPGLAPRPLSVCLDADPPAVVMSLVAGVPLTAPVPGGVLDAMADAITASQEAVPAARLAELPPRAGHPSEMVDLMRSRCATRPRSPLTMAAFEAGTRWLATTDPDRLAAADPPPVFGTGDGKLANHLWDGSRVRLVDFEFSGRSDRAYELAEVAEHVSLWRDGAVGASTLLSRFDLSAAESARLLGCRRLLALFWLCALPPDLAGHQAVRVLALLDSDTV